MRVAVARARQGSASKLPAAAVKCRRRAACRCRGRAQSPAMPPSGMREQSRREDRAKRACAAPATAASLQRALPLALSSHAVAQRACADPAADARRADPDRECRSPGRVAGAGKRNADVAHDQRAAIRAGRRPRCRRRPRPGCARSAGNPVALEQRAPRSASRAAQIAAEHAHAVGMTFHSFRSSQPALPGRDGCAASDRRSRPDSVHRPTPANSSHDQQTEELSCAEVALYISANRPAPCMDVSRATTNAQTTAMLRPRAAVHCCILQRHARVDQAHAFGAIGRKIARLDAVVARQALDPADQRIEIRQLETDPHARARRSVRRASRRLRGRRRAQ